MTFLKHFMCSWKVIIIIKSYFLIIFNVIGINAIKQRRSSILSGSNNQSGTNEVSKAKIEKFAYKLFQVILDCFGKLSNDTWYNSENTIIYKDGEEEFYFEDNNKFNDNEEFELPEINRKSFNDYKDLFLFDLKLCTEEDESGQFSKEIDMNKMEDLIHIRKSNSNKIMIENINDNKQENKDINYNNNNNNNGSNSHVPETTYTISNFIDFKEYITTLFNKMLRSNIITGKVFLHIKTYFIPCVSDISSEITNSNTYKFYNYENSYQYYNSIKSKSYRNGDLELLKNIPDYIRTHNYFNLHLYVSISDYQNEFLSSVFEKFNSIVLKSKLEALRNNYNSNASASEINYTNIYNLFSKIDDKNFACDSLKFYIMNEIEFLKYFEENKPNFNIHSIW